MLPLVSEERREEALRYKHLFGQFACLKSYVMLRELLETRDARLRDTGLSNMGLSHPFRFEYNEHGKPFLADHPDIHFNISHCKNGIAVAVADQPIGIDIESYRQVSDALLRYTMNEEEQHIIQTSEDPIRTFTEYWTKKEAVFKLRGTGITHDLQQYFHQILRVLYQYPLECPLHLQGLISRSVSKTRISVSS